MCAATWRERGHRDGDGAAAGTVVVAAAALAVVAIILGLLRPPVAWANEDELSSLLGHLRGVSWKHFLKPLWALFGPV